MVKKSVYISLLLLFFSLPLLPMSSNSSSVLLSTESDCDEDYWSANEEFEENRGKEKDTFDSEDKKFEDEQGKEKDDVPSVGYQLTYKDIAQEHLKSLTGDGEVKIPIAAVGQVGKFIERQRGILLGLDHRKKLSIIYDILAESEKDKSNSTIIDHNTWQDLNLLNGSEKTPQRHLGSLIDRTDTSLGRAFLLGTIARPTADAMVLKKRQNVVRCLMKNEKTIAQLSHLLKKMSDGEEQLLSFWNSRLQLPGTIRNQYWRFNKHVDKLLNDSNIALDIKSAWATTQKCLGTTLQGTSALLLTAYTLSSLSSALISDEYNPVYLQSLLEGYATRFTGTAGPMYAVLSVSPWLKCGAAGAAGILNALSLESAITWTKADLSIDSILQEKLVKVATYITQMQALYNELKDSPLVDNLVHFKDLKACLKSDELEPLLATLSCDTFTQKTDFFFRRGNVLRAYNLLTDKKVRTALAKGLVAVAEIDMFVSVVQLYNEFKDKKVTFCFPTYLSKDRPLIDLKDYWNIFIDPNNVVKNSTILGQTEKTSNAVITGPNSAGKSTILKSIALSIILAQSIGIAPAYSMAFTPFSHVATYMDITDDISDKTSLFQSEVDRSIKLEKTIRQLKPGTFSFSLFDELFSGTSPEEGMAYAYATAEAIGNVPNSICMIATHYSLLTTLAKKTSCFSNYKVSVKQGKKIERLYTLEPGVAEQHIALDVAKERGVTGSIIDGAAKILAQVK